MQEYLELIDLQSLSNVKMKNRCMAEVEHANVFEGQDITNIIDETKRIIVRYFPQIENYRLNSILDNYFSGKLSEKKEMLLDEFSNCLDKTFDTYNPRIKNNAISVKEANYEVCNLDVKDAANNILNALDRSYGLVYNNESSKRFDRLQDELFSYYANDFKRINSKSYNAVFNLNKRVTDAVVKYINEYEDRKKEAFDVNYKDVNKDGTRYEIASAKERYIVSFNPIDGSKTIEGFKNDSPVRVREFELMDFLGFVAPDMEELIRAKKAEYKDVTMMPFGSDEVSKEMVSMSDLDQIHKDNLSKFIDDRNPTLKPFGEDPMIDELGTTVKPLEQEKDYLRPFGEEPLEQESDYRRMFK